MKRRAGPTSEHAAPAPSAEPVVPLGAPYDPVTVPVRKLAEELAKIDDADAVRALRSVDPRTSAERHYEVRLEELG